MLNCYLSKVGTKVVLKGYSLMLVHPFTCMYDFSKGMSIVSVNINDKNLLKNDLKIGDVCDIYGTLMSTGHILFPHDTTVVIGHSYNIDADRMERVSTPLNGYEVI